MSDGQYEFLRVLFGLSGAIAPFQKAIDSILLHFNWKRVVCYVDNTSIGGKNLDTHLGLLHQVLTAVSIAEFTLFQNKCKIALNEDKFLGHIIDRNGLTTEQAKREAVKRFKTPTTPKEVNCFVGSSSYYFGFIRKFAELGEPLIKFTRKDIKTTWNAKQKFSHQELK